MFALLNHVDAALAWLPDVIRIGIYGLVLGAVGMLLYWMLSPQRRIVAVKREMVDRQAALRAYKGTDLREILRLSKGAILPALKQVAFVIGPTLVAILPVIAVMAWMESAYASRLPNVGDVVAVTVVGPARSDAMRWEPTAAATGAEGRYEVRWPRPEEPVRFIESATGSDVLILPFSRPTRTLTKPSWWHTFLAGSSEPSLPAGSAVTKIELKFPDRHVIAIGPAWLRTWLTPLMIGLTAATLGMKFALKIA